MHLRSSTEAYSQTRSSWSMVRDFIQDNIFIVIFTSSRLNDHDKQIYTLIGPFSTSSAKRGSTNICWRMRPEDGSHIHMYILLYAWSETNKHLDEEIHIFFTYKNNFAGTNPTNVYIRRQKDSQQIINFILNLKNLHNILCSFIRHSWWCVCVKELFCKEGYFSNFKTDYRIYSTLLSLRAPHPSPLSFHTCQYLVSDWLNPPDKNCSWIQKISGKKSWITWLRLFSHDQFLTLNTASGFSSKYLLHIIGWIFLATGPMRVKICSSWLFHQDEKTITMKMSSLLKFRIVDPELRICEYGIWQFVRVLLTKSYSKLRSWEGGLGRSSCLDWGSSSATSPQQSS